MPFSIPDHLPFRTIVVVGIGLGFGLQKSKISKIICVFVSASVTVELSVIDHQGATHLGTVHS